MLNYELSTCIYNVFFHDDTEAIMKACIIMMFFRIFEKHRQNPFEWALWFILFLNIRMKAEIPKSGNQNKEIHILNLISRANFCRLKTPWGSFERILSIFVEYEENHYDNINFHDGFCIMMIKYVIIHDESS